MNKKQRIIELCKELRLPSIRHMVQEETSFKNPEVAFDVLLQVLLQEQSDRYIRAKQNRIRADGDGVGEQKPDLQPQPNPDPEPQFPINVNTADKETLMLIPGVGETIAGYIIEYRNTNGPFTSIEQLDNVKQIGPATIEKMRPYITL